jgi:hypothetical protein
LTVATAVSALVIAGAAPAGAAAAVPSVGSRGAATSGGAVPRDRRPPAAWVAEAARWADPDARLENTRPATSFTATGYFHTAFVGGRWWLVTPTGQPFYSAGIDHVTADPDTTRNTDTCPYCTTVAADYPSTAAWAKATAQRLRAWGFNTISSFSSVSTFSATMPYTVLLTMANGSDWFARTFVTSIDKQAESQVAPRADTPNLIGYITDSELQWGPDWRGSSSLLSTYLALPAGAPGRAVAQQFKGNPTGFLFTLATRYFSVVNAAIRKYDPHHLILGAKVIAQLIQPALLEAARPYVDVFSVDDYAITPATTALVHRLWPQYMPVTPTLANIESYLHVPLLIGEYSFRADGSGPPNSYPPIYPSLADQGQRAAAYAADVSKFYYSAPWMVGDEWFEYVDEPDGGRTEDGENSNFGTVNVDNRPYATLTDRMVLVHAMAPDRVADPGRRCGAWARHGKTVTCILRYDPDTLGSVGPITGGGYWLATGSGAVLTGGDAPSYGSMAGRHVHAPVVGMASTPDDRGYWLVAADGEVFPFGDARSDGSLAGTALPAPIVGIAGTPAGAGYWLFGADGTVYPFGGAGAFGSVKGQPVGAPMVAMAPTPDGNGYWLVARDGEVFAFGDATRYGSSGARATSSPAVAIAATPDGRGYWVAYADGKVTPYGDARDVQIAKSSMAGGSRVVGIVATPRGYRMVTDDGSVLDVGGALPVRSPADRTGAEPVVAIAS